MSRIEYTDNSFELEEQKVVEIGDGVFISPVEIKGDKVRIGFLAQQNVSILRQNLASNVDDMSSENSSYGFLVLSLKPNEKIFIGEGFDTVTLELYGINDDSDKAMLNINSPKQIGVFNQRNSLKNLRNQFLLA